MPRLCWIKPRARALKGDGFDKLEQRLQDAGQEPLKGKQVASEPQLKQPNILDTLKLDQAIKSGKEESKRRLSRGSQAYLSGYSD